MLLYLMRHAHAVEPGEWLGDEAARPLTAKGRKRAARAAAGLAIQAQEPPQMIVTSPYARARETAVIVGQALGVPVEACAALAPGFALPDLEEIVSLYPEAQRLLLVGHEPDLSGLARKLIRKGDGAQRGDKRGAEESELTFKKATCALIETPHLHGGASAVGLAHACDLLWLLTWRALAALAPDVAGAIPEE